MKALAYGMGGTWLGMVLVAVGLIALAGSWTGTPGCATTRQARRRLPQGPPTTAAVAAAHRAGLSGTQAGNAAVIVRTGRALGIPRRGQIDALATAEQESNLENLPYGPQGSLGLFQQRPSQGWGTPAEIMNPVHAAKAFYTHLRTVGGWATMSVTAAAQAVQHSAAPAAYAKWKAIATRVVASLDGGGTPATQAVLASATRHCTGAVLTAAGGYRNPLRGIAALVPERIDRSEERRVGKEC